MSVRTLSILSCFILLIVVQLSLQQVGILPVGSLGTSDHDAPLQASPDEEQHVDEFGRPATEVIRPSDDGGPPSHFIIRGTVSPSTSSDPRTISSGAETPSPAAKLGEACTKDDDCRAAFAQCYKNICTCDEGFEAAGSDDNTGAEQTCYPTSFTCPFGDGQPLMDGEDVMSCQIVQVRTSAAQLPMAQTRGRRQATPPPPGERPFMPVAVFNNDSCPAEAFCQLHSDRAGLENRTGHCCALPQPSCPVGKPDLNASCGISTHSNDRKTTCDVNTHYCNSIMVSNSRVVATCCPKPCRNNQLYLNGKCYARKRAGESCEISEQCGGPNAECLKGKCTCTKGFISSKMGYCYRPMCRTGTVKPQDPLLDPNGDVLRCNESTDNCPKSSFCAGYDNICCPLPEAYCPDTKTYVTVDDRCDLKTPNACGKDKYCRTWYSIAGSSPSSDPRLLKPGFGSSAPVTQVGLCCPVYRNLTLLPMFPVTTASTSTKPPQQPRLPPSVDGRVLPD